MEFNTFGSALKFGVQLEELAITLYLGSLESIGLGQQREELVALAEGNRRRKRMLGELYNKNVYSDQDTGIFEPIPPMSSYEYTIESSVRKTDSPLNITLTKCVELEKTTNRFYLDLATRLESRRRRLAESLRKIAKENLDRGTKIKGILDSNMIE